MNPRKFPDPAALQRARAIHASGRRISIRTVPAHLWSFEDFEPRIQALGCTACKIKIRRPARRKRQAGLPALLAMASLGAGHDYI